MEEGVDIGTEESEEGNAQHKGRTFRQVKQGEGVGSCLPSADGGRRTRAWHVYMLSPTFPTPLPGVGCSLL